MDAGVPLATIQRWLGHHNISQTSTYLAASLGGDESAIMRAYENGIGRLPPLTHIDLSGGFQRVANRPDPTARWTKRLNQTRSCTNRRGSH